MDLQNLIDSVADKSSVDKVQEQVNLRLQEDGYMVRVELASTSDGHFAIAAVRRLTSKPA